MLVSYGRDIHNIWGQHIGSLILFVIWLFRDIMVGDQMGVLILWRRMTE